MVGKLQKMQHHLKIDVAARTWGRLAPRDASARGNRAAWMLACALLAACGQRGPLVLAGKAGQQPSADISSPSPAAPASGASQ
jgi:predicted small lipoprotein YifL